MGPAVRRLAVSCFLLAVLVLQAESSHMHESEQPLVFRQPLGAVIIDPGHGGRDPGAVGTVSGEDGTARQLTEKEVNLDIALRLQEKLGEMIPDVEIHMLREDDTYLSLYRRVQTANSTAAREGTSRLFVSIHANAAHSSLARGFEIWVYRGRKTGRFVEPAVSDPEIVRMTDRVDASLHQELHETTDLLAESVLQAMKEGIGEEIPSRGIKERDYYVIRHTMMPAVLVEAGFLTHPEEVLLLDCPEFRGNIAEAVAEGIYAYADQLESR